VPHVRGLLGIKVRVPGQEFFSLKEVVKQLFGFVGTLFRFWEIKVLSVAVELVKFSLVKARGPPANDTRRLM